MKFDTIELNPQNTSVLLSLIDTTFRKGEIGINEMVKIAPLLEKALQANAKHQAENDKATATVKDALKEAPIETKTN